MIDQIDFIGIGAAKCGTTLLAKMLGQHPNVAMPHIFSAKEVDFFTDRHGNYKRGIQWYLERFQPHVDALAYGEFSPSYFSDLNAPRYILRHFPDARLICMLRDPAKRAFSWYQQRMKACDLPPSTTFADAATNYPWILLDSHYSVHLRRYLDFFPSSQLHVMFLEDLIARPSQTYRELLHFLKLPDDNASAVIQSKVNGAWLPRSYMFQKAMCAVASAARMSGLQPVTHLLRRLGPAEWVFRMNKGPARQMSVEEHELATRLLGSENDHLCELLERESLPWMRHNIPSSSKAA